MTCDTEVQPELDQALRQEPAGSPVSKTHLLQSEVKALARTAGLSQDQVPLVRANPQKPKLYVKKDIQGKHSLYFSPDRWEETGHRRRQVATQVARLSLFSHVPWLFAFPEVQSHVFLTHWLAPGVVGAVTYLSIKRRGRSWLGFASVLPVFYAAWQIDNAIPRWYGRHLVSRTTFPT